MNMQLLDLTLWILAGALLVPALWWSRRMPRAWEPARLFAGLQGRADLRQAGEDWQPSDWLGAGITWDNLGESTTEPALRRRLEGLKLLWLGEVHLPLPGLEPVIVHPPASGIVPLAPSFEAAMDTAVGENRQVIVAAGPEQGMNLLKLLHAAPGLRDRCRAVLLVNLQPEPAWIAAHFDHTQMDTELYRQIPYLCLRTDPAMPLLENPPPPPSTRTAIDVVDLGVNSLADPAFGRALVLLLAALTW